MAAAWIIRQDPAGVGEQWQMNVGAEFVTLAAPSGHLLLQWTPTDVDKGVQFPSFSKSIKYTGFNVVGRGSYQFAIDSGAMKLLRAFANRGIAARGPQAIRQVFRNALLTTLGGAALFIYGICMLVFTVLEATTDRPTIGRHPIGFITSIFGLAILCRGLFGLQQYKQLKKLGTSQELKR